MVEGYIEPVPEFYARVLALTRMTRKGLDDMKVLDDQSRGRIESLEGIVERLLNLSMQELQGKALQPEDYGFINSFGEQLKAAVAGVDQEGLDTTIIADVHTDANSGQVLEEGTGNIRGIVVAYPMPDGGVVAGVGPVFSYYEFRHPMANRLTDEAWKAMLREGKAPALPEWAASFSAEAAGARIPPGGGPGGRIRGPIRRLDPGVEKVIDVPVKIDALPERRPKQKLEPVPAPAPEIKQKDKPE
jgi:hypothetical protein